VGISKRGIMPNLSFTMMIALRKKQNLILVRINKYRQAPAWWLFFAFSSHSMA
jgi:hypothetical protein